MTPRNNAQLRRRALSLALLALPGLAGASSLMLTGELRSRDSEGIYTPFANNSSLIGVKRRRL